MSAGRSCSRDGGNTTRHTRTARLAGPCTMGGDVFVRRQLEARFTRTGSTRLELPTAPENTSFIVQHPQKGKSQTSTAGTKKNGEKV